MTEVSKTLFSVKKMKDSGNIVIFGADEGDMIINTSTGIRSPIIDTGREFVLDIYIPVEDGEKSSVDKEKDGKKPSGEKISFGCKATIGGFWSSRVQEEEESDPVCEACCPATFRRHS